MLGKALLACATFVVAAVAQSQIAFTVLPTNITAGQTVELQWAGGDRSPVTLTLQQGLPSDLQTVQLITGSATGTSYNWKVPSSLPDASNYAFKIQQGDNPPNYTGMITLTGGSTTGATLAVSTLASTSSTASASSATSSVPTSPASGGVVSGSNSTTHSNATTTAGGTGAVGSGSAATGTAMSRNSTMSIATLTSSSSSSFSFSSAAATSSGSSTGTTTSSAPSPSSSKSAGVTLAASNFALFCAAVVGVAYLG